MRIAASAPSRISLFGGGTDLPFFYENHGGMIISLAINLRNKIHLFTKNDLFQGYTELAYGADPELCWAVLKQFKMNSMHHAVVKSIYDGIIGAGLGSSASFAVALVGALMKNKNLTLDKKIIASVAREIEVEKLGWAGGCQDQIASAYGGFNAIGLGDEIKITPLDYAEDLISHLLLVYVGGKRKSHKIQKGFEKPTEEQVESLIAIRNLAIDALDVIAEKNWQELGKMLDTSWSFKKKSNDVSTKEIDEFYEIAIKNGAWGGKLLGAGKGGYMVFIVPPDKRKKVLKALEAKNIEEQDFMLDKQGIDVRVL